MSNDERLTRASEQRSPRQTLTYLRGLFEARGLQPRQKLGQCFLIDLNLIDLIVRLGEVGREDLVIEVGTGTGSLTARLAEHAGAVLGVELDSGFFRLAQDSTAHCGNVTLLNVDVLRNKNQISPIVLEKLAELRQRPGIEHLKLIANLPYVVATPVITDFLVSDLPFERMVVTVQWEVAERLAAEPSSKAFGSLAVLVQSLADVAIIRRLRPGVFWPRPKVDSGIVVVRPLAAKRARIADVAAFQQFIRDLYIHRRKNLRGALLPFLRDTFTKESLDDRLRAHGFDPSSRAEALAVEQHLQLFEALRE